MLLTSPLSAAPAPSRTRHPIRVTVADDGPGVPVEERQRVFDRFVRLDASRAHNGSAGLGLAIAKEIVLAHRGRIAFADPDPGSALRGARVVIDLPR